MKHVSLFLFLSAMCFSTLAQQNEFEVFNNGLIYSEGTMQRLAVIVDSLNLKFRACDVKAYRSIPQGFAHYIANPGKEARRQMLSGISFDEYERKFPRSVKQKNVWITKHAYNDYNDEAMLEYAPLPSGEYDSYSVEVKNEYRNNKSTGWILSEDGEKAFYLLAIATVELPKEYARLVQYVDCMIDTTTQIYFEGVKGSIYEEVPIYTKAYEFISWAESFPRKPEFPDYKDVDDFDSLNANYSILYSAWDSLRMRHIDNQMATSRYWNKVLLQARDEAIENKQSYPQLEFYVARYLSESDVLTLMRCRKVVGGCSMDLSPRYHAINICRLAAQTAQWDIFLRAHLDIMNDRFDRVSDGSYAWEQRKTYLKELEELDIPAVDLLVGTSLRIEKASKNHYFGSIGRTGRALADAKDKAGVENRLVAMIQNEKLDPYNRTLCVYLFANYVYNLEEGEHQHEALATLEHTKNSLPEYLQEVVSRKK